MIFYLLEMFISHGIKVFQFHSIILPRHILCDILHSLWWSNLFSWMSIRVRLTKNQLCCSSMPSHKFILQLSTQLLYDSYLFILSMSIPNNCVIHFAERTQNFFSLQQYTMTIVKYLLQLLDHWLAHIVHIQWILVTLLNCNNNFYSFTLTSPSRFYFLLVSFTSYGKM